MTIADPTNQHDKPPAHSDEAVPLGAIVWKIWPWMGFALALWVSVLRPLLLPVGWEGLFLLMFSILLVPLVGLVEWLPRIVLRSRHHNGAPPVVICVLLMHWSLVFILPLCWEPSGVNEPSGLAHIAGQPVAADVESIFLHVSWWGGILSWTLLLILCIALKPRTTTHRSNPSRVAALLLAIALSLGAPALSVLASGLARDASGATLTSVRDMSDSTQATLATERDQTAQEQLSQLRQQISSNTWTAGRIEWDSPSSRYHPPSYGFTIEFTAQPITVNRDALDAWMSRRGYEKLSVYPEWRDASGNRISIGGMRDDEVNVTLSASLWWGDGELLSQVTGTGRPTTADEYAGDDWPELNTAR